MIRQIEGALVMQQLQAAVVQERAAEVVEEAPANQITAPLLHQLQAQREAMVVMEVTQGQVLVTPAVLAAQLLVELLQAG
jgi:antitoxin component of MazEF toxin-antitoxin module